MILGTTTSEMPSLDPSQQFITANNSSTEQSIITSSTISPDKFDKSAPGHSPPKAYRGKFKTTLFYCAFTISIINLI